jgi:hypothetical protein
MEKDITSKILAICIYTFISFWAITEIKRAVEPSQEIEEDTSVPR